MLNNADYRADRPGFFNIRVCLLPLSQAGGKEPVITAERLIDSCYAVMGGNKNRNNGMGVQHQFVQREQRKFLSGEPSAVLRKPIKIYPFEAGQE